MTIDSRWLAVWKRISPGSFTPKCPFTPSCAIMDGMPLLMCGDHVKEWRDLLTRNFCHAIDRYLSMGCERVVVAFDDYSFVSPAKSITQSNRDKVNSGFEFGAGDSLPTSVPEGYTSKIRNRNFKRKVIDYIATHLPYAVNLKGGKSLVIDYVHVPVRYWLDESSGAVKHEALPMPPMGEADIKWVRFVDMWGDSIVHSVDGDYIPISLMAHEDRVTTGRRASQVAIYRLEYKSGKASAIGKKRKVDGQSQKNQRTWEFVNVQFLYKDLQRIFTKIGVTSNVWGNTSRQIAPRPSSYMRVVALLIGLSGTDFSRPLTHLTPEKIWSFLPNRNVWEALMKAYNHMEHKLDVAAACDLFVAELYKKKFSKYTNGNTLEKVMHNLQVSTLSASLKQQLPTPERVATTIKNVNYLLLYWECTPPALRNPEDGGEMYDYSVCCPDAICEDYGFRRGKKGQGAVTWLDC